MAHTLPRIYLAPIHEYTTLSFRQLCYQYGAQQGFVPLFSATRIARRPKAAEEISCCEKDGIQLFGSEPADFRAAAKLLSDKTKWIDINCGCPSPRALDSGGGAELLKSPEKITSIVKAAVKQVDVISVKIRLLPHLESTLALCKKIENAGADALFVHGRTVKAGYSGDVNYAWINEIAAAVSIPVIGNGDISSIEAGVALAHEGKWHGFMIGRSAMKNPAVFSSDYEITEEKAKKMLREYATLCKKNDELSENDLRAKAFQFFHSFPGSVKLRREISEGKFISAALVGLSSCTS